MRVFQLPSGVGPVALLALFLALFIELGAGPRPLHAQNLELVRVAEGIQGGRFDEARRSLEGWLTREWGRASRGDRQEAIWLRAVLAMDPREAELDYRRLVLEYPGGTRSDEALLRLAQGARARGDQVAGVQYLEILTRDYPLSPHRLEARALMTRMTQDPPESWSLFAATSPGPGPGAEPGAVPSPRPPLPATPGGTAPVREEDRSSSMDFTLQLGAFATESRALGLAQEARDRGLDVRVVRVEGSELTRVRMGAFPTREGAEEESRRLRLLGFEAVISSDRIRESWVR